ncbi:unnamed protein product [Urochloa humidicola]
MLLLLPNDTGLLLFLTPAAIMLFLLPSDAGLLQQISKLLSLPAASGSSLSFASIQFY